MTVKRVILCLLFSLFLICFLFLFLFLFLLLLRLSLLSSAQYYTLITASPPFSPFLFPSSYRNQKPR
ncbi:hypothetical protein F4809DRAFT_611442 [Biscogniauxia mediterranea]|nr:hypothetical protein F4809DRAFT_611442 [Biscogniauxia mediterranea]